MFRRTIAKRSKSYRRITYTSTTFPGAPPIKPNPTAGFLVKLTPALNVLNYTVFLGAQINGLAVLQPPHDCLF
jgi:hypothetical protein